MSSLNNKINNIKSNYVYVKLLSISEFLFTGTKLGG